MVFLIHILNKKALCDNIIVPRMRKIISVHPKCDKHAE